MVVLREATMNKRFGLLFMSLCCFYLFCLKPVYADNPIIKDRFTADPAALVYDDKVYLYVGHDEASVNGNFFVMREWNVFSSADLENWELVGTLPRTEFTWAKGDSAWASQAVEKDGIFYWYVTVLNNDPQEPGYAIGVAKSDHPAEGFKDALGQPLITSSMTEAPEFMGTETWDDIDPSVFIDDDGQAYMYWGNTHLYYVKLKDNMIEIDGEIQRIEIENMPGSFTEGPFLHKYNDMYYLTYAMNYPEEIGYAVSDSPEGPWTFKGKIMDVLPNSATSHPAVIEFNDEWYFIYHTAALPTGGEFRRSVSIEKLSYQSDGTIEKIIPTASGISDDTHLFQLFHDDEKYIRHAGIGLKAGTVNGNELNFEWYIVPGLANDHDNYLSFQVETKPGFYIKRNNNNLVIAKHDGADQFMEDATFKAVPGLTDKEWTSFTTYHDQSLYLYLDETDQLRIRHIDEVEDEGRATFRLINDEGHVKTFTKEDNVFAHPATKFVATAIITLVIIGMAIFLQRRAKR